MLSVTNKLFMLNIITLSVIMLNVITLSVIMLSHIMLSVIMLNVITLSVLEHLYEPFRKPDTFTVLARICLAYYAKASPSVSVSWSYMLSATNKPLMLSIITLFVIMLNVITLNVVAPLYEPFRKLDTFTAPEKSYLCVPNIFYRKNCLAYYAKD
jgi:hypothetical protein